MNDKTTQGKGFDRDEETMARLLRLAGPRSPIPTDIQSRVYNRVKDEWRSGTSQAEGSRVYAQVRRQWAKDRSRPRIRRWALPAALAASMVISIAVVLQPPPPAPVNVPVGSIARVVGENGSVVLPGLGQRIYRGERLSTGRGQGISLVLSNAESLRLDQDSTLVVDSGNQFTLLRGRVYADTGDFIYRDRGLVIDTAIGSVTDVGTQFAVALNGDELELAVREGRVDVDRRTETFVAIAGERMQLGPSGGAAVDALAAHDSYWDWATALAPAFDIKNKSLLDFLRWAARESGRKLEFESDEMRMSAMRIDLHGSTSDFDPLEAVPSVMATTRFEYRVEVERDKIVVQQ